MLSLGRAKPDQHDDFLGAYPAVASEPDNVWKAGAVSDNNMIGPGAHEDAATGAVAKGESEEAKVFAILALASAVNRLAAAQEAIANT